MDDRHYSTIPSTLQDEQAVARREAIDLEIESFQARLLAGTWTRRDVVRLIEINQILQAELQELRSDG